MSHVYSSPEFEAAYTYPGTDLGALWTPEQTTFRLWAPTADAAAVCLYKSGNPDEADLIETLPLLPSENGTWVAEKIGNLDGIYYTFQVRFGNRTVEACDPYAKTTGVNGQRAMILDLSSTNPAGWEQDCDPHAGIAFPDAVIYELHVRDVSMDPASGIQHKGKFLGLIETGTTTPSGIPTGLDHIKALGATHLHLLPVYDYGSVDETALDTPQFNWGYDPVNFNVPEGSYSTDPYHGEVRVREMKQMIQGLHRNGISVIMDVVYNHVYDAEVFCFNKLVPGYFSRIKDGVYSNGSGCGNDTASERSMVRKYIVDSVCYWADEYHIDGFRFDLVGLLDVDTINAIVASVHEKHPNVLFYGEGWTLDTHLTKPCELAIQPNSAKTPGFAYFSDTIRDLMRGSVFYSDALGYVTGATGIKPLLDCCIRGLPDWCTNPCQSINYVSCHDNNTLFDRISLATPDSSFDEHMRMCRLAAVFYITAQGIPFMQAGEEMLRSKPDGHGGFVENSFNAPDSVNRLNWQLLEQEPYQNTLQYYKGLLSFRKAHPVLRMTSADDIRANLKTIPCDNPHMVSYLLRGDVVYEPSDALLLIFNAANIAETISLPAGTWHLCIDADRAGTDTLRTVTEQITVPPLSAMVLVQGQCVADGEPVQQINQSPASMGGMDLGCTFGGTCIRMK